MTRQTETENNANRTKERVRSFLQSRKGRVIVCACAAAIVLAVVLLLLLTHRTESEDLPGDWPTGELMEGIQPPEQGRIESVRQTDTAVTVYFEEFPESALPAYVKALGASPAGDFTYVAQKGEDRVLAVLYDPAAKRLSLTVTSVE